VNVMTGGVDRLDEPGDRLLVAADELDRVPA
jgi:hypothetical protein